MPYQYPISDRRADLYAGLGLAVVGAASAWPLASGAYQAAQQGRITFLEGRNASYPHVIDSPYIVRTTAGQMAGALEPRSLVIMNWAVMHPTAYILVVEQGRRDVSFIEIFPTGTKGRLTESFVTFLDLVVDRRPVYIQTGIQGLWPQFEFTQVDGLPLYRVTRGRGSP